MHVDICIYEGLLALYFLSFNISFLLSTKNVICSVHLCYHTKVFRVVSCALCMRFEMSPRNSTADVFNQVWSLNDFDIFQLDSRASII